MRSMICAILVADIIVNMGVIINVCSVSWISIGMRLFVFVCLFVFFGFIGCVSSPSGRAQGRCADHRCLSKTFVRFARSYRKHFAISHFARTHHYRIEISESFRSPLYVVFACTINATNRHTNCQFARSARCRSASLCRSRRRVASRS